MITIDREQFAEAYGRAAPFSASRSPKPVLQHVMLKPMANFQSEYVLVATDLECGAIVNAPVIGDLRTPILLGDRFGQILKQSRDPMLTIEVDKDNLLVQGLHSNFALPLEDWRNFPTVDLPVQKDSWSVYGKDFRRLVRQTVFATDAQSTRYALSGCLVEVAGDKLSLIGTDGRRLSFASAPVDVYEGDPKPPKGSVIPAKALRLVDRLLDEDSSIIITLDGSAAWFYTDNGTVKTNLVEGRFPNYRDVFPAAHGVKIVVSSEDLAGALQQGQVVCSDESRGLDCRFTEGLLTLAGQSANIGSAKIQFPVDYHGDEIEFTIDPQYILGALKAVDGDVTLEVIDAKQPVQIHHEGFRYVAMPLTRE